MTDDLEQYLPHVYRFALRLTGDAHLAEDLCHDTFVRAIPKRDPSRESSLLKAWLLRITANLWKDSRRSSQELIYDDMGGRSGNRLVTAERVAELAEERQAIINQIQSLPQRQRSVLHLYAIEEMTIPDIAHILELTCQNVRVHLHDARKAMRSKLPDLTNNSSESLRHVPADMLMTT